MLHRILFQHLEARGCWFSVPEYHDPEGAAPLELTSSALEASRWAEALIGGTEVNIHRPDGLIEWVLIVTCNHPAESVADYGPTWETGSLVAQWTREVGDGLADRMLEGTAAARVVELLRALIKSEGHRGAAYWLGEDSIALVDGYTSGDAGHFDRGTAVECLLAGGTVELDLGYNGQLHQTRPSVSVTLSSLLQQGGR